MRFSRKEWKEIGIAVAVLSLAFSIILVRGSALYSNWIINYMAYLGISFLLTLTGFMMHELAHKLVAQKYGAWAEFRMFSQGLILALFLSLFGFLFAAPGAVYIQGRITKEQNGIISAAGPGTNLILGAVSLATAYAVGGGVLAYVLVLLANINVFLGLFNLLPIPPLDGSKVYAWNPVAYIGMAVIGVVMLMVIYGVL